MAGKQNKAKKDRGNHDKETGMFAFTFLTITSFPATHAVIHRGTAIYSLSQG